MDNYYVDGKIKLINSVMNSIDSNTYTYLIEASSSNPSQPSNDLNYEFNVDSNSEYIIDFSNVNYLSTGIHEYYVSEKASSNLSEFPLSNKRYKIIVAVTNKDGKYVANVFKKVIDLDDNTKKSKLEFKYNKCTYLIVKLNTKGNNANNNEYFKVGIKINNYTKSKYHISGLDRVVSYRNKIVNNPSDFTFNSNNDELIIYIKSKQTGMIGYDNNNIVLYQIPIGSEISLVLYDSLKYQTSINGITTRKFLISDINSVNVIEIVNVSNYDVAITGLSNSELFPFILTIVLSFGLLIYYSSKRIKLR